jgi:hypothetical protein
MTSIVVDPPLDAQAFIASTPTTPASPSKPKSVLFVEADVFINEFLANPELDFFVERALAPESPGCFGFQPAPVELRLDLRWPVRFARTDDPVGTCLGNAAGAVDSRGLPPWDKVIGRPRYPLSHGGTGARTAPQGDVAGDIALLRERLAGAQGTGARPLELALATRLVDLELVEHRSDRGLEEAESLLEGVAHDPGAAELRRPALERLAYVAESSRKAPVAVEAHLALVCPGGIDRSQEHSKEYWAGWEAVHSAPLPKDLVTRRKAGAGFRPVPEGPQHWDEETVYRSPFSSCTGDRAESWFAIGRWESLSDAGSPADAAAGPFHLRRASEALARAAGHAHPKEGVALYARLWLGKVLIEAQRFRSAVAALSSLLGDLEATSDRYPEIATRAEQLLGGILADSDLAEASEADPDIARPAIAERVATPQRADRLMRQYVGRLGDASLLPQGRPWTPAVVRWATQEVYMMGYADTTLDAVSFFRSHWPLDEDLPSLTHIELGVWSGRVRHPSADPQRQAEATAKLRELRSRILADFGDPSAWTTAHKEDSGALEQARHLLDEARVP